MCEEIRDKSFVAILSLLETFLVASLLIFGDRKQFLPALDNRVDGRSRNYSLINLSRAAVNRTH